MPEIKINAQRLMDDLMALATFTEPNTPGWTRRFPSEAYLGARQWLRRKMETESLVTHLDEAANLIGRLAGRSARSPIFTGSHTDTVMGAGRFDGMLGVLGPLEAIRALREAGVHLHHPLCVVDYFAEEANDYAIACLGSLAIVGEFNREWLKRHVNGLTLERAIMEGGGLPQRLGPPLLKTGDVAAHLELHIEQGPVLDQHSVTLGAVDGIVGIRRARILLHGKENHAGTWPMNLRHDALAAAGQMITVLEAACRAEPKAVGTIGKLDVSPNQGNVIPGQVMLMAEVRHLDMAVIDRLWEAFITHARAACKERGVTLSILTETRMESVIAPKWLHALVLNVCQKLEPRTMVLSSGAGHDTSYMAQIAPAAMIFVPSIDGRSHSPEENTLPEHLARGVRALAEVIVELDNSLILQSSKKEN